MLFSQRIGITPLAKDLQLDSMDDDLRICLWNVISLDLLQRIKNNWSAEEPFMLLLWQHYFKKNVDEMPTSFEQKKQYIKHWFFLKQTKWYDIYNFIEITINLYLDILEADENGDFNDDEGIDTDFYDSTNEVLEREFSAYRFIDGILAPISNEQEKREIENVLELTSHFTYLGGCNTHLSRALELISHKPSPDYRNSIKESISAVESLAKVITGKGELGPALSELEKKVGLNKALSSGFKSMYGYTSGSDGIRHSLTEASTSDFEDAKFMLVSCSAFINYLIGKCHKAGIQLQQK